jgi:surface carbohydrate biosynthesis protein
MSRKKILLIMNYKEREYNHFSLIKKRIERIDPSAEVLLLDWRERYFTRRAILFRPIAVLTFPFTSVGLSRVYYLLKFFFKTKIITLRTEGILDLEAKNFEKNLDFFEGFDRFGPRLVDYDLHWGADMAIPMGKRLLKNKKISSLDRVKVVGYPRLEWGIANASCLSNDQCFYEKKYPDKKNRILILTGFQLADYTEADLFLAGDLDANENLDALKKTVYVTKYYRDSIIDTVNKLAVKFPEYLFIIKLHPLEQESTYKSVLKCENVFFPSKLQDILSLVNWSACVLHYGSTSIADAYIAKTASVLYRSRQYPGYYGNSTWPNTSVATLEDLTVFFEEEIATGNVMFISSPKMESVLLGSYGYVREVEFVPTLRIAELLLDSANAQKVSIFDKYLYFSLFWTISLIRDGLYRLIKR